MEEGNTQEKLLCFLLNYRDPKSWTVDDKKVEDQIGPHVTQHCKSS